MSHDTSELIQGVIYAPFGQVEHFSHRVNSHDNELMDRALAQADLVFELGDDYPVGVVLANAQGDIWEAYPDEHSAHRLNGHAERNAIEKYNRETGILLLTGLAMYSTFVPCYGCAPALDQGELSALHVANTRSDVIAATKFNGKAVLREYDYDLGDVIGNTPRTLMVTYGIRKAAAVERFVRKKQQDDESKKAFIKERRRAH